MADEKLDMDTVPARIHEDLRQVMLGERRRAEKAERERDEAREQRDLALCDVVLANEEIAYVRDRQYDSRVRELEADISARDEQLAAARSDLHRLAAACGAENPPGPPDLPERVKANADEFAALRWLVKWCASHFSDDYYEPFYAIGDFEHGFGLVTWNGGVRHRSSTLTALATALDPEWRTAGSKED